MSSRLRLWCVWASLQVKRASPEPFHACGQRPKFAIAQQKPAPATHLVEAYQVGVVAARRRLGGGDLVRLADLQGKGWGAGPVPKRVWLCFRGSGEGVMRLGKANWCRLAGPMCHCKCAGSGITQE